ncbi:MAG: DNA mismatch repair endonuclease MutL [Chloroflexi bacterium]|nr:DNA mismatch repair endonuclease MutL [Chloroflexota bacterium]
MENIYSNRVEVLPPDVANKIAAGEVIERPASVVKELVENAIDAGAADIRVEVRGGGLQLIRVIDDGAGIADDDMETCFQRHATSKIRSAEDLGQIRTLGFRGEALPSIAAVAKVTLVTRPGDSSSGSFAAFEAGAVTERGRRGCPPGTSVSVQNLFSNIPARLKYLKAAATELSHISHLISNYALAYPELRFTLINDGRLASQSIGDGNLVSALIKVYGITTAEGMFALEDGEETASSVHVGGYVSQPAISRSNRNCISFFVNRRWVQSRSLTYALEEAYHPLLADGRHPVAAVNVRLPFDEIDVNVHPTKSEVRFLRDREVFARLQKTVRRTLTTHVSIPALVSHPSALLPGVEKRLEVVADQNAEGRLFAHDDLERPGQIPKQPLEHDFSRRLPILRVIGQMGGTFVVAEGPQGMYLVDQHRAHERVLFERLARERGRKAENSQLLLEPLTLELTARQAALLTAKLGDLAEMGLALEQFGDHSFLVRSIPAVLVRADLPQALYEIVDQTIEDHANGDWQDRLTATLACKGAIKAGQVLSLDEMRELLVQLEATSLPPKCPHGAPTMVHLSQAQLEKQFGR